MRSGLHYNLFITTFFAVSLLFSYPDNVMVGKRLDRIHVTSSSHSYNENLRAHQKIYYL